MSYKRIKSIYKKKDIRTGDYVLLAISDEDSFLKSYQEALDNGTDKRWAIINPNKPYDKITRTNCFIHIMKIPITRGWYQVTGTRDGIQVISISKPHRRSKPRNPKWEYKHKANIYLNNILDIAKSREEMIAKREESK